MRAWVSLKFCCPKEIHCILPLGWHVYCEKKINRQQGKKRVPAAVCEYRFGCLCVFVYLWMLYTHDMASQFWVKAKQTASSSFVPNLNQFPAFDLTALKQRRACNNTCRLPNVEHIELRGSWKPSHTFPWKWNEMQTTNFEYTETTTTTTVTASTSAATTEKLSYPPNKSSTIWVSFCHRLIIILWMCKVYRCMSKTCN